MKRKTLLNYIDIQIKVSIILEKLHKNRNNISCSLLKRKSEFQLFKATSHEGDKDPIKIPEDTPQKKKSITFFSGIKIFEISTSSRKFQSKNEETKRKPLIDKFSVKQENEILKGFEIIYNLPIINQSIFKQFQISLKTPFLEDDCKKTLLLDLDETLIYTLNEVQNSMMFDLDTEQINAFLNDNFKTINFIKRPYLHDFLSEVSKGYEIIVF